MNKLSVLRAFRITLIIGILGILISFIAEYLEARALQKAETAIETAKIEAEVLVEREKQRLIEQIELSKKNSISEAIRLYKIYRQEVYENQPCIAYSEVFGTDEYRYYWVKNNRQDDSDFFNGLKRLDVNGSKNIILSETELIEDPYEKQHVFNGAVYIPIKVHDGRHQCLFAVGDLQSKLASSQDLSSEFQYGLFYVRSWYLSTLGSSETIFSSEDWENQFVSTNAYFSSLEKSAQDAIIIALACSNKQYDGTCPYEKSREVNIEEIGKIRFREFFYEGNHYLVVIEQPNIALVISSNSNLNSDLIDFGNEFKNKTYLSSDILGVMNDLGNTKKVQAETQYQINNNLFFWWYIHGEKIFKFSGFLILISFILWIIIKLNVKFNKSNQLVITEEGVARNVRWDRMISSSYGVRTDILSFSLEKIDPDGNPESYSSVYLETSKISGTLAEGDRIKVSGKIDKHGNLKPNSIYNYRTETNIGID
jgi:hypothetical protein